MRVDANPNTLQFAQLSRNTGQVQNLRTLGNAPSSAIRNVDGDQFVIRSRAEVRAAQQTEKTAQLRQTPAQLAPQASLSGPENGRRFQPDFAKVSTDTPKSPTKATTQAASETTGSSSVFGQAQLDAVNKFFGTRSGDRGFDSAVDFNNDGSIDFSDITYILSKWGEALPAEQQALPKPDLGGPFGQKHLDAVNEFFGKALGDDGFLAQADANGDGTISFSDITHILANWGQPTGKGTA